VRVLACAAALGLAARLFAHSVAPAAQPITWNDLAPLQRSLEARGISATSFSSYRDTIRQQHLERIRDGDFDHLIFYALQGSHFTRRAPIEPALSAKAFVSSGEGIPSGALARLRDLLAAIESSSTDPRIGYFRALVRSSVPDKAKREAALVREYTRAMQFLYQKEFVAQRTGPDAVAELYRSRGLSTDTAVEAGYVVYTGLGIVRSLDPKRRIRRVLIVGPGLDLAPRTGLLETGPPESYQPWAVIDALVSLGLARLDDLEVIGADINPRVVDHLARAHTAAPSLTLVTGIREDNAISLTREYRDYFAHLGSAIGTVAPDAGKAASGHLLKTVRVSAAAANALTAAPLDIVTERLEAPAFDLIVATNILPYFDDAQLMLAMTNIARMLAPGGVFLHNEPRPALGEITDALGMPYEQSRQVIIADVRNAAGEGQARPAVPLGDSVWLHRKGASR
jgi:SAM-dependent methyltransferase